MAPSTSESAQRRLGAQATQRVGTRQLLLGRACFIVTGYAVSIILARSLVPAELGVYGVLVSLVTWLGMLSRAGVPGATSKLIAGSRDVPGVERSASFLLLVLGASVFTLCWLAAPWVEGLFQIPNGTRLFRLAILDIPLTTVYAAYQGILGGHRRFGPLAAGQALYGLAKLLGVVALVRMGISVGAVLVVNALATLTVCVFLTACFPPRGLWPSRALVSEIVVIAIPVGAYVVGSQVLLNLDLWSLKSLWRGDQAAVGHYVASLSLARMLIVIPSVQGGVLFASVAWALSARDETGVRRHIHEATRFALILVVPACVLLGSSAAQVMGVLYSDAYSAGGRFLQIQLVAFALFGLLDIFGMVLIAASRTWLTAGTMAGLIPVVWAANRLLIGALGPLGAAVALAVGMSVGAAALGTLTYRRFGRLVPLRTLARVGLAAVMTGAVSLALPVGGVWVLTKLAALAALYLLILLLTGELTLADFIPSRSKSR